MCELLYQPSSNVKQTISLQSYFFSLILYEYYSFEVLIIDMDQGIY